MPAQHPWTLRDFGTSWRQSLWFRIPTAYYLDYDDQHEYTDYQDYDVDNYPTDETEKIEKILELLHLQKDISKGRPRKTNYVFRL